MKLPGKLQGVAEEAGVWGPLVVKFFRGLAQRIRRRRAGEPETHGDEGGHPEVYPLDATRKEIRERREGGR